MSQLSLRDGISLGGLLLLSQGSPSLSILRQPDGQHPGIMQSNGQAEQIDHPYSHRREWQTDEQTNGGPDGDDTREKGERCIPDPVPRIEDFITMQDQHAKGDPPREKQVEAC